MAVHRPPAVELHVINNVTPCDTVSGSSRIMHSTGCRRLQITRTQLPQLLLHVEFEFGTWDTTGSSNYSIHTLTAAETARHIICSRGSQTSHPKLVVEGTAVKNTNIPLAPPLLSRRRRGALAHRWPPHRAIFEG